ncbi:hypothetical protein LINPERPRIM_LOCUS6010 [Linum perenne]
MTRQRGGEKVKKTARPTRRRRRDAGVVTARQHRPKKTLKHKVYKWRKEIKEA